MNLQRSVSSKRVSPLYSFTPLNAKSFPSTPPSSPLPAAPSISPRWESSSPIIWWIRFNAVLGLSTADKACLIDAISLGPASCSNSSAVAVLTSISRCRLAEIFSLHTSNSALTSLFPDGSSMCNDPFSLCTRETRIGGKSPSNSSSPLAKAAAVFMTRPSSLVLIFRSCRNVECSRNIPPPFASGYISWRSRCPRLMLCFSPSFVRFPPHFNINCTDVHRSCACPLSSSYSSKLFGFICNFRFNPTIFHRSNISLMCNSSYRRLSLAGERSNSCKVALTVNKNSVIGALSLTFKSFLQSLLCWW